MTACTMPSGEQLLRAVAPEFGGAWAISQAKIIDAIAPIFHSTLAPFEISTPLRVAHFLAQTGHESAGFRTTEEFASGRAYEGREDLGNTQPGDGERFKGRGLIQLTGRANYRRFGALVGMDLEASPGLAAEPGLSLRLACLYWREKALNYPADRDDIVVITRAINGGFNGLSDRKAYLTRAKRALGLTDRPAEAQPGTLRRGDRGEAVAVLQAALGRAGHPVAIDGDFGPRTERAVRAFQTARGLVVDGIVGPRTRAALTEVAGD